MFFFPSYPSSCTCIRFYFVPLLLILFFFHLVFIVVFRSYFFLLFSRSEALFFPVVFFFSRHHPLQTIYYHNLSFSLYLSLPCPLGPSSYPTSTVPYHHCPCCLQSILLQQAIPVECFLLIHTSTCPSIALPQ